MGLFKLIDRHIRKSNAEWSEGNSNYWKQRREEDARETEMKKELELEREANRCCANCEYFETDFAGSYYLCNKYHKSFDAYDIVFNNEHYKKRCSSHRYRYR